MFRIIGSIIILVIATLAYFNMEKSDQPIQVQQPVQSDDSFKSFKIN